MKLIEESAISEVRWVVLSGEGERAAEARRSAEALLERVPSSEDRDLRLPRRLLPVRGQPRSRSSSRSLKADFEPDLILTHQRDDLHQDHRLTCELTWNTFRDHLILEYEIPKYDGDMGAPNSTSPSTESHRRRKIDHLMDHFASQRSKHWFTETCSRASCGCAAWSATRRAATPRRSTAARPCSRDRGVDRQARGAGDGVRAAASALPPAEAARARLARPAWPAGRATRQASRCSSTSAVFDRSGGVPSGRPHLQLLVPAPARSGRGAVAGERSGRMAASRRSRPDRDLQRLRAGLAGGWPHLAARQFTSQPGRRTPPAPSERLRGVEGGAEHLVRSAAADLGVNGCAVCALDRDHRNRHAGEAPHARLPRPRAFVLAHEEGASRPPRRSRRPSGLARREPEDLNGRTSGWRPLCRRQRTMSGAKPKSLATRLFPLCGA